MLGISNFVLKNRNIYLNLLYLNGGEKFWIDLSGVTDSGQPVLKGIRQGYCMGPSI